MTISTTPTQAERVEVPDRPSWSGLLAAWHIILDWMEGKDQKSTTTEASTATEEQEAA